MPRGRVLRTKVRDIKALTRATIEAQQAAEGKKPFQVSVKEHIGKMIDKIDPLKAIAVLGFTLSLKTLWDSSEELLRAWNDTWKIAKIDEPKKIILHISAEYYRQVQEGKQKELKLPYLDKNLNDMEIAQWLVCFSVSYMIVEHPEILSMGIMTILKGFIK